jgi:hypothetical protein
VQIRLCDEDREHFKVDTEWVEWDPLNVCVADLDEMAERFGFLPMDWPEPFFGALTLEQAGNPDAKPVPPRWQLHAAAWMALRQAGLDVSWEDAGRVRLLKARSRPSPGKDSDRSPDSDTSTTPPSASSSTSARKKSAA